VCAQHANSSNTLARKRGGDLSYICFMFGFGFQNPAGKRRRFCTKTVISEEM
jgi:hypothetical protein